MDENVFSPRLMGSVPFGVKPSNNRYSSSWSPGPTVASDPSPRHRLTVPVMPAPAPPAWTSCVPSPDCSRPSSSARVMTVLVPGSIPRGREYLRGDARHPRWCWGRGASRGFLRS